MPMSSRLHFASSNHNKYREVQQILESLGVQIQFFCVNLLEIQSDSLCDIAVHKVQDAFSKCNAPVLVEDDGLYIDALGGFPGPYSSFVFDHIGNDGILKLVDDNRKAKFVSVISYYDGDTLQSFESSLDGTISLEPKGKGWGYDPIFIPVLSNTTFADISDISDKCTPNSTKIHHTKNDISHRSSSLKKFANWYMHMRESFDR